MILRCYAETLHVPLIHAEAVLKRIQLCLPHDCYDFTNVPYNASFDFCIQDWHFVKDTAQGELEYQRKRRSEYLIAENSKQTIFNFLDVPENPRREADCGIPTLRTP